jgi:hypothetical protein
MVRSAYFGIRVPISIRANILVPEAALLQVLFSILTLPGASVAAPGPHSLAPGHVHEVVRSASIDGSHAPAVADTRCSRVSDQRE